MVLTFTSTLGFLERHWKFSLKRNSSSLLQILRGKPLWQYCVLVWNSNCRMSLDVYDGWWELNQQCVNSEFPAVRLWWSQKKIPVVFIYSCIKGTFARADKFYTTVVTFFSVRWKEKGLLIKPQLFVISRASKQGLYSLLLRSAVPEQKPNSHICLDCTHSACPL